MTPDWRRSASAALSAPASDPVWEEAALAPAAERPAFRARTGFFFEMRLARRRKFAGFWKKLGRGAFLSVAVAFLIQFAALPVLVWSFGTTTPWFFLNALWLPVLGFLVFPLALLGTLFAALDLTSVAGCLFTVAAWPAQALFFGLDALEARGWFAVWTMIRPHWLTSLGFYAALGGLVLAVASRRAQSLAFAGAAVLACMLAFGLRHAAETDVDF